jgi:hypothetical protein
MEAYLLLHRGMLWLWAAVVVVMVVFTLTRRHAKPADQLKLAQK